MDGYANLCSIMCIIPSSRRCSKHGAELWTCTAGLPTEALEGPKDLSHMPNILFLYVYQGVLEYLTLHCSRTAAQLGPKLHQRNFSLSHFKCKSKKESANARLRIGTRLFLYNEKRPSPMTNL